MQTLHDFFGDMELNEQGREYRAMLEFSCGHKVSVTIDWAGISPSDALKLSRDICERIQVREPEYRNKIAQDLLPLYNDAWGDGQILDADSFMHRISLADMVVSPADFCATLYYADGDLFAGHSIEVFLDGDFTYVKSQLAG